MNNIIEIIEQEQMKKETFNFRPGDLIKVNTWIVEGNKKRLQIFEGTVIAIRRRGLNSSFIVRRVISGEGIERVFQIHSPSIESISIIRCGSVRKAKLYYLRKLTGRSARIKERLN